jgi:heterodisulfide reductase subunit B
MGKEYGQEYDLPIVYFTQLMGLALGLDPETLGMDKLFVDAKPLLQEKGMWPES